MDTGILFFFFLWPFCVVLFCQILGKNTKVEAYVQWFLTEKFQTQLEPLLVRFPSFVSDVFGRFLMYLVG